MTVRLTIGGVAVGQVGAGWRRLGADGQPTGGLYLTPAGAVRGFQAPPATHTIITGRRTLPPAPTGRTIPPLCDRTL